jgi:membrane fusion protein, multidrug efflux system
MSGMIDVPLADTDEVIPQRPTHRSRRRRWRIVAVVLVAVAAAGTVAIVVLHTKPAAPHVSGLPPATAAVVRTTLTQTQSVDGTLGYPPSASLTNRLSGTVTSTAAAGTVVRQGQALYAVDQAPVILLYGTVPDYRALQPGTTGADVQQFEQDLHAIGYGGFTVDANYTDSTALAVRHWQHDLGLPQTGTVDVGRIVFLPAAVRIAQTTAQPGQLLGQGGPVLSYTDPNRIVTANVDVNTLPLLSVGTHATVTLPGGATVGATVATVGSASTDQPASGSTAPVGPNQATFPVTFALADQGRAGSVTGAPVTIAVVGQQQANVLAVPVTALLALREGGYGVQVVQGTTTRVVAVRIGMFANGLVQVSGPGITTGTVVGVASS